MRLGAIVLAGGGSTRMGVAKATLDRDGVAFVCHVVSVAHEVVAPGPVVVAVAPGQMLPELPPGTEIVHDAHPDRGPLEGIRAGLDKVAGRAEAVLVLATDLPLVVPELGRALFRLLALDDDVDAVVPVVHDHRHPLAAVYRTTITPLVSSLLERGTPRAGLLLDGCRSRLVDAAELLADVRLASADPELASFLNVNTSEELEQARLRWRSELP